MRISCHELLKIAQSGHTDYVIKGGMITKSKIMFCRIDTCWMTLSKIEFIIVSILSWSTSIFVGVDDDDVVDVDVVDVVSASSSCTLLVSISLMVPLARIKAEKYVKKSLHRLVCFFPWQIFTHTLSAVVWSLHSSQQQESVHHIPALSSITGSR